MTDKITKRLICIECPVSCSLSVDVENCRAIKVDGNKCPKGERYAVSEIENPVRVLTSGGLAIGLELKMIPVRTDQPIPKEKILEAMSLIKKIRVDKPVQAGSVIVKDFLVSGVNLIATRPATD